MIFIHNPEYAYFNYEFSPQTQIPRKHNTIKEMHQAYGRGLVICSQCKCTQPWKVGITANNTHKGLNIYENGREQLFCLRSISS